MKNPITARKITVSVAGLKCPCCDRELDIGEKVWREMYNDLDGDERGPHYVHFQCPGDDETRAEYRKALNEHLLDEDAG